jgi:hypothetical protein
MRRHVLARLSFAFVAIVAMGCGGKGSPKLEGHWKGTRADGVAPPNDGMANEFAKTTEITVRGNQISITTPAAKNVNATYVVEKDDKTTVVIKTDKDNASETFTFENDGTMTWKVDEKKSIVFTKVGK